MFSSAAARFEGAEEALYLNDRQMSTSGGYKYEKNRDPVACHDVVDGVRKK